MDKFSDWGRRFFCGICQILPFHYEGRSRNLISASSPKSRINEFLPQARSPLPFPAGMTPDFTPIYQDLSQMKHFFVDSELATLHSQNSTFSCCWPAPLLLPGHPVSQEFLSWNSFPPPISCAERSGQVFAHWVSHHVWRIKYWSYFCCKAWRNKMLSVFLKVVFASFPALPRDVFFSSEWNLWMAQGVCCAQCVCTSSFSPPTPGILPDDPFSLLHLFQIPLPKLTDSLSCPRSGNFSFIPGGRNAQARESNIALQRL